MCSASEPRGPVLCYITDRRSLLPDAARPAAARAESLLLNKIERAAAAGVDWIQLREKDLSGHALTSLARAALQRIRGQNSPTRLFVNDRIDAALASGAGGVHLGETGISVEAARRLNNDFRARHSDSTGFLIGASCHSVEAVRRAAASGADYVYFGPVFATPSKVGFGAPQGLERLSEACRARQLPVIAIGGITQSNAAECLLAGAAGIAAIRLFQDTDELGSIAGKLHALPCG